MALLYVLFRNLFLSLFVFCFLHSIQMEPMRTSTTIRSTTSTTTRMPPRSPGLSLPMPNSHPPKCMREVPAVFFQFEKNVEVIGNSTNSPHFNLIEVCCKGYKRYDYDWDKCVPDCGEKCHHNGFCLPGGRCQCFDEFVMNDHEECVPTCPLGCPNGRCYLNGTCICHRGFELDPSLKFCVPICEMGCGHNEYCAAPNECHCAEGYAKSADVHNAKAMGCQPLCIPDCGYGHCVAPNQCECFAEYQKRNNSQVCEGNCYMRCENGFCANRTTCVCQNGYKYDNLTTSCLPDCGDNCENGVCISPGVCRCFNGYIKNGLRCDAICENGCSFYGKCIAPNVCGCSLTEGPFKSYQQCKQGKCNPLGRCHCNEGTMRFINQCLSPDKLTTYASMRHRRLNESLVDEFNLLIGQFFRWNEDQTIYNHYLYNPRTLDKVWFG